MARIVDFQQHCCRRIARFQSELEEHLDADGRVQSNGLAIRDQAETAMYRHVEEALELWRGDVSRAGEKP